jgi:hypothetical protein
MPHNALNHNEPSISHLSTEPITDPNSAICATLSGCKRRAVKDASPSNNYKQKEGEGQVFSRPTTKK